jgi:ABC-type nitrate/sulfonate/bicarbonate transport system substrate-binding protein
VTHTSVSKQRVVVYFRRLTVIAIALIALTAARPASAQDIAIGEGMALQWAHFYVADHYNTWKGQGLGTKVTTFASGRLVMDAVLGGGVLIGTVSETPVVFAALNGLPVRIIATLNRFEPFDLVGIKEIKTGKDLKGRKIGISQGTNGHYFFSKVLASAGLSASDVTSVNLSPADFISSLANGSIDAFIWTEPHLSQAMSMGEGKFHVVQFPNLYFGYSTVIALQSTIDKEPQVLIKALKSLEAANGLMGKDANAAADLTADRIKLDPKIARAYWPRVHFGMALAKDEIVKELESQAKWAIESKLVRPDAVMPNFQEVVVTKPLSDAQSK